MIIDEYKIEATTIKIHDDDIVQSEGSDFEKNAICNIFKKIESGFRS